MSESYMVKGNICVTLKDDEGYIIRHKLYSGMYFCIDFKGKLVMATGARFYIEPFHWKEIQDEINTGYEFMSKYIFLGATKFNITKQNFIRNPLEGYLYSNNKGEAVFFLVSNTTPERAILELNFFSSSVILSHEIKNNTLYFYLNDSINRCFCKVGYRKTTPKKLIRCISYIGTDFKSIELWRNGEYFRRIPVERR